MMKQMRSRFRLIMLLLGCAFLLTLAVCTGSALKAADITLSSITADVPSLVSTFATDSSASPEISPPEAATPAPSEPAAPASSLPGTDNSPVPEYNDYNTFGL